MQIDIKKITNGYVLSYYDESDEHDLYSARTEEFHPTLTSAIEQADTIWAKAFGFPTVIQAAKGLK